MKLTSPAFDPNQLIPSQYTCDGENMSPPLHWDEPPEGTQSLALICDVPDAPGKTWVHWIVYNLPNFFVLYRKMFLSLPLLSLKVGRVKMISSN